jgi:adenylate cyclase
MGVATEGVIYRFDDFRLDLARGVLLNRAGAEVPLRNKSFRLLRLFVENAGRLMSHEAITHAVWPRIAVNDQSIAQCVRDIRRALGDDSQTWIRTVPRRGYIFAAAVSQEFGESGAARLAIPSSGKPSIAVLAFDNLSGDPGKEHFSDGITEDIITAMSRTRSLLVTSRNSSFTYKGKPVDVKRIAREMGVRYVMEGSVQTAGSQVRVTAKLVDAESGGHVWAERYDRLLTDTFTVRDEITAAVAASVQPVIAREESRRAMRKSPEDLTGWEAWQRALWHWAKGSDHARRHEFLQRTLARDPDFAPAHAMMARLHLSERTQGGSRPFNDAIVLATGAARAALDLDPESAVAHAALAWVLVHQGDHEAALEEAQAALTLDPSDPQGYLVKGHILALSGRPDEAGPALDAASQLDPFGPNAPAVMHNRTVNNYLSRNYSAVDKVARCTIRTYPAHPRPYVWLAAALGQLGYADKARSALNMAIIKSPSYLKYKVGSKAPYMRLQDHKHLLEGLRKAGWEG